MHCTLFLPKVLDLQTTRNTYLFTDSLFGANSLGGLHQSDTVAACSALYLAKPCAAKMRSNCHSTRSPNHQRLIYKIGRSSTAKKLLASFHTHRFVASACVACAFRHSTRLGELLLGQYDVLFQMLQSLTLANISIIEFFSTEKIYHASFVGVPPVPERQSDRRTVQLCAIATGVASRSTRQSRRRAGSTATSTTYTSLATLSPPEDNRKLKNHLTVT